LRTFAEPGKADEDRLKKHMIELSTSTYNNTASVWNSALKAAVRWRVIPFIPHRFALLKRDKRRAKFYDFDEYHHSSTSRRGRAPCRQRWR